MTAPAQAKGRPTLAAEPAFGELRAILGKGARRRREELAAAVLDRIQAISDTSEADPTYLEGLHDSVHAAIDYVLQAIEAGEERAPAPPPALLAQARLAARNGVSLDTVLRRYVAGYTLFGDFLAEEAKRSGLPGDVPALLMRGTAALLDRLLAAVSEEYERATATRYQSLDQRRAGRVQRLLAGESLDTANLAYEMDLGHLAAIVAAPGGTEIAHELASAMDCRVLIVERGPESTWAWFGARRLLDPAEALALLAAADDGQGTVALGEPARGLAGWRLTHRQAAAALSVAMRGGERFVRYSDVALLASVLQDELLRESLRRIYLVPLEAERDGGSAAKETLRAYLAAQRNVTSAAAALHVTRNTVASRLRAVEDRIERPLHACLADLEIAMELDRLDGDGNARTAAESRHIARFR